LQQDVRETCEQKTNFELLQKSERGAEEKSGFCFFRQSEEMTMATCHAKILHKKAWNE
jgi:hypothetical protein